MQNEQNNFLEVCIGKLDVNHGISNRKTKDRVQFNYVDCHPKDNSIVLLVGGSIASINKLTKVDEDNEKGLKYILSNTNEEYNTGKILYGTKSKISFNVSRLIVNTYHSPSILNRGCFDSTGNNVLLCDNAIASVWNTEKDEIINTYRGLEIFDASWLSDQYIVVGSIGKLVILSVQDMAVIKIINIKDNLFVRGISVKQISKNQMTEKNKYKHINKEFNIYRIAIMTNNNFTAIYELLLKKNKLITSTTQDNSNDNTIKANCSNQKVQNAQNTINDNEVILAGEWITILPTKYFSPLLADCPLSKIPSFSPCGNYVVFPYADRRSYAFGLLVDLTTSTDPYRFRGHHSRVNYVAFSNLQKIFYIPIKDIFAKLISPNRKIDNYIIEKITKYDNTITNNKKLPIYYLIAISSLDGCISIWFVFRSNYETEVSASCIFVTPTPIVDQSALITSMAWANDNSYLIITSDDGKCTLISFDLDEKYQVNVKII